MIVVDSYAEARSALKWVDRVAGAADLRATASARISIGMRLLDAPGSRARQIHDALIEAPPDRPAVPGPRHRIGGMMDIKVVSCPAHVEVVAQADGAGR
jgi:hypothetical protein